MYRRIWNIIAASFKIPFPPENSRLLGLVSWHYTFWQSSKKHSSHTHNHLAAFTSRNAFLGIDSSVLCTPFSQKALNFSTNLTKLAHAFRILFPNQRCPGRSMGVRRPCLDFSQGYFFGLFWFNVLVKTMLCDKIKIKNKTWVYFTLLLLRLIYVAFKVSLLMWANRRKIPLHAHQLNSWGGNQQRIQSIFVWGWII